MRDILSIFGNMKNTKNIAALLVWLFITPYCQSQNKEYGNVIPPVKAETSLDSLYPKAYNMNWHLRQKNENLQAVTFDCSCQEGLGLLTIVFDTSGNIITKDVLISKNDLPDKILDYITSNYPTGFMYGNANKIIDGREISYRVNLFQTTPSGDPVSGGWTYILKFKNSGDFISMDKK